MAQTPFNPTPGVSTHQDCVDTINANVTDAEDRLVALESSPSEPTLESVTTNGATTTNDIEVGRIVTAGNTLGPVETAANSIAIGGTGNSALGPQSEVIGGGGSSVTGTGSTIVGGNTSTNSGNWAIIAGGRNHANTGGSRAGILGGEHTTVTHADSAMLAVRGTNATKKESQAIQTAHVDNLHIFEGGFKMPTGAAANHVLTTDANGVGTWQAANNHTHTVSDIDSALAAEGTVATADGAGNVTWEVGGGGAAAFSVFSVTTAAYTQTTEHTNYLYDDTLLTPGGGGSGGSGGGGACMIVDLLPVAQHVGITIHKKIGDSCEIELVAPVGSTIDGAASYLLTSQYEAIAIFTDGTNYFVQ